MRLSPNLTLAEVIRSDNAKRLGINNYPTPEHLENLKLLALYLFQPIRDHFGVPIYISSGYRSKELNKHTPGSSVTSQHSEGQAIDIDMDGSDDGISNLDVFNYIKDNLIFDQLIAEFPFNGQPSWVHVSYRPGNQRRQVYMSVRNEDEIDYIDCEGGLL